MYKNLLLGLLLAVSVGAAAQNTPRVAFTAGLQSTTVDPVWNPHPLALDSLSSTTARTGIRLGFIASIPLGNYFRLQPAFLFSAKGATQIQGLDTAKGKTFRLEEKQFINYVDIPVNLVAAIPLGGKTKFIIGGGPQASLFYNGTTSLTAFDTSRKFTFNELSDLPVGKEDGKFRILHFGVNALAGFEFGRVFLNAHYSQSLTPYLSQNGKEFNHTAVGASIGIFLGRQTAVVKATKSETPKDSDGDGVPDATDTCPDTKGPAENKGCPWPDSDGDGILDKHDRCPSVAGQAQFGGCPPPDEDGDGVIDSLDKCPKEKGTAANNGCPEPIKAPEVKKEVVEQVTNFARAIEFANASAKLLPASLPVLDELATLLTEHAELKLTVEGHTSATGKAAVNQALSEQRALAVKKYLEGKGIQANRIQTVGYGSSRPISDGKSEAEQAKNRRVELKTSY
ncbi:OmpA family protein [Paracnuella aquatica]|uniref:OmpA family protein n=1 Tax=Paracnuella aquatica TaxID=2268757 RepID=UPI000DEF10E7|nr:OmpA family protein [Paracnuella aquatica]RPD51194.1 hypothetical protein DRJ53_00485 [Paracnuella aquatica]